MPSEFAIVPIEGCLEHSGVKGMRWGVIRWKDWQAARQKKKTDRITAEKRKAAAVKAQKTKKAKREAAAKAEEERKRVQSFSELSNEELNARISRLKLEQSYKELLAAQTPKQRNRSKEFVMDVLEKSGKDIATQFAAHAMGTALNKLAGEKIVNPDKLQKAK